VLIRNTPYPPGYHDIRVSWILVPGTGGRWPVAGIRAPPPPSGIRRPEIRDPGSGLRIRAPGIRGSLIPDPRSPIPDPGSGLEKWGFLLAMCSTGRPRGFSPDPRCRLKRKLCRPASQPYGAMRHGRPTSGGDGDTLGPSRIGAGTLFRVSWDCGRLPGSQLSAWSGPWSTRRAT